MSKHALAPAALKVTQAVSEILDTIPLSSGFIVGCSGGADSMALSLAAHQIANKRDIDMKAVIVDHGLQQNSAKVASEVKKRLEKRNISAEIVRVQVKLGGNGLEAHAREARLAALESFDRPVLLGHTMNDQAEQVLLGLIRGSGTRSLSGMAINRGVFWRPMLGLRHEITEKACLEWGIEIWDDPMNLDTELTRVRVRKIVIPLLEKQLGPGIIEALSRTATLTRWDADMLDEIAMKSNCGLETLDTFALNKLGPALRLRVIRNWLSRFGAEITFVNLKAVDSLVTNWHGQHGIDISGAKVLRINGKLTFQR